MQYVVRLPEPMKLYYNPSVYSPEYSSIDTILITDKLIKDGKKENASVLDVGCGSGVIGLGVKKLNPFSEVTLCDTDFEAVRVTKLNAKRLGLSVKAFESDLIPKLGEWDIICANLPTYSAEDMSQELNGPITAYYSAEPLGLYSRLFKDAVGRCKALVCECQLKYQEPFLELAESLGWVLILRSDFGFAFQHKPSQS